MLTNFEHPFIQLLAKCLFQKICMYLFIYWGDNISWQTCRDQRATCGRQLACSTMWVSGTRFRSSRLVARAILLVLYAIFFDNYSFRSIFFFFLFFKTGFLCEAVLAVLQLTTAQTYFLFLTGSLVVCLCVCFCYQVFLVLQVFWILIPYRSLVCKYFFILYIVSSNFLGFICSKKLFNFISPIGIILLLFPGLWGHFMLRKNVPVLKSFSPLCFMSCIYIITLSQIL